MARKAMSSVSHAGMRKVDGLEEARELLGALELSGLSMAEFCALNGVNRWSLAAFKGKIKALDAVKVPVVNKEKEVVQAKTEPKLPELLEDFSSEVEPSRPWVMTRRENSAATWLTFTKAHGGMKIDYTDLIAMRRKWASVLRKAEVRTRNNDRVIWLRRFEDTATRFASYDSLVKSGLRDGSIPAQIQSAVTETKTLLKMEGLSAEESKMLKHDLNKQKNAVQALKRLLSAHSVEVDRKRRAVNYRAVRGLPITLVEKNTEWLNQNRVPHSFTTLGLGVKNRTTGRRDSQESTRAPGLIDFVAKELGMTSDKDAITPVFPTSSEVETAKKDGRDTVRVGRPLWRWFCRKGYVYVGAQVLDREGGPNLLLDSMFSNAVDKAPYSPSLFTPLVTGGWLGEVKVRVAAWREGNAQVDGSGYYHPNHPDMTAFAERQGWGNKRYAVQVRGMLTTPEGELVFVKGEMAPSYAAVDKMSNPAIFIDVNQLKGDHKGKVALDALNPMWMGVIRKDDVDAKAKASYQVIENFQNVPEVREYFQKRIEAGIARMVARGIDGLVEAAAEDSPAVQNLLDLVNMANASVGDRKINPLSIRAIHTGVTQALGRELYQILQSGKLSGQKVALFMDASLEPGTCVIDGYEVGSELVVWRAPTLGPQGLRSVKVVARAAHHLGSTGEGRTPCVPKFLVYLHPHDAGLCMQGDDDGDQIAVSKDKDLLALVKNHRLGHRLMSIEPPKDGKKRKLASNSPEGVEWTATDHKGPVGQVAIARSRLLAANTTVSRTFASYVSVVGQEAVDMAKREVPFLALAYVPLDKDGKEIPQERSEGHDPNRPEVARWSYNVQWTRLAKPAATGEPVYGLTGLNNAPTPRKEPGAEFPFEALTDLVARGMGSAGLSMDELDPLWWRNADKTVHDITDWTIERFNWLQALIRKDGWEPGITVENAIAAMAAWLWHDGANNLKIEPYREVSMADQLADAFDKRFGGLVLPRVSTLSEEQIRSYFDPKKFQLHSAIERYCSEIERVSGESFIDSLDDREQAFAAVMEAVEAWVAPEGSENPADMAFYLLKWYIHEEANQALLSRKIAGREEGKRVIVRKPQTGLCLRVLATPGGPFLRGLGLARKRTCNWATSVGRELVRNKITEALASVDPVGVVSVWLESDVAHLEATSGADSDHTAALFHCEACRNNIWKALLRETRSSNRPAQISEGALDEMVKPICHAGAEWSILEFLATNDILAPTDCFGQVIKPYSRVYRVVKGKDGKPNRVLVGRRTKDKRELVCLTVETFNQRKAERQKPRKDEEQE